MNIAVLVGMAIAIVVGVSLIPIVTETVKPLTQDASTSSAIMGIADILPIVLVAVIIIGSVGYLGFAGEDAKFPFPRIRRNPNKKLLRDLRQEFEKISSKYSEYINNLDCLLDISTIKETGSPTQINKEWVYGLFLTDHNELLRNDNYHWYIAEKHPTLLKFKIVGIHKKDPNDKLVYILGKNDDRPYLYEVGREDFLTSLAVIEIARQLSQRTPSSVN